MGKNVAEHACPMRYTWRTAEYHGWIPKDGSVKYDAVYSSEWLEQNYILLMSCRWLLCVQYRCDR